MAEGIIGLVGVVIGIAATYFMSRAQRRDELEQLQLRLQVEWDQQWQWRSAEAVSELLAAVDPELHPSVDKLVVVPLVHKAQLLLNLDLPTHARCNDALNRLALDVNGWLKPQAEGDTTRYERRLGLVHEFLEAARATMRLPGR